MSRTIRQVKNLRAAGTWLGTPVGLVALWLAWDWFFSTNTGASLGLLVGTLALVSLALLIGAFFYVFRE
jgi:hypothetical protein